ncbi:MAG: hypothetical protein WBJ81_05485 [Rickettsiales bacterium]
MKRFSRIVHHHRAAGARIDVAGLPIEYIVCVSGDGARPSFWCGYSAVTATGGSCGRGSVSGGTHPC